MTKAETYRTVRLMHDTMLHMNNEEAYCEWIYTMPDEPSEDDFMYFVDSKEEFADLKAVFFEILDRYAEDGLYGANPETQGFFEEVMETRASYKKETRDIYGADESPCIVDSEILLKLPEYQQDYLCEYDYFLYYKRDDEDAVKICLSAFDMDDVLFDTVEELEEWTREQIELFYEVMEN